MSKTTTIEVSAAKYEGEDDCLNAAVVDYLSNHHDALCYDLNPRWADDERSTILLDVPNCVHWTYETYRNMVLGPNRNAADVVREFDLDPTDKRGMDEWLGTAEGEAWAMANTGEALPAEWGDFHARVFDELLACDVD